MWVHRRRDGVCRMRTVPPPGGGQRRTVLMQRRRGRGTGKGYAGGRFGEGGLGGGHAAWRAVGEVTAWKRKSSASIEFSRSGFDGPPLQKRQGATLELLRGWWSGGAGRRRAERAPGKVGFSGCLILVEH